MPKLFGVKTTIKAKNHCKWIKPILQTWLRVNRDYIEEHQMEDALYWYNERANVGALAGAIWRSGGYALEEFSAVKGKESQENNKRVDLYFRYGSKNVICEAKQYWVNLPDNNKKDFSLLISNTQEKALSDIRKTNEYFEMKTAFGIGFYPTYSTAKDDGVAVLNKFRTAVKSCDADFFAWFELDTNFTLRAENQQCCNAVALIGSVA